MTTAIDVRFNRPQSLAHQALQPGNTVTIPWGRGVGKSYFLRTVWYLLIAQWDGVEREASNGERIRGVRIVHLMPTFKQCVDIHGKLTQEELYFGKWKFLGGRINRTRWSIDFPGGSWIQFFGTSEANNNRGIRCDVVTEDEADDIEPGVDAAIVTPFLSEPWSLQIKLRGGTPRRGRNGLLWLGHKAALDRVAKFHSFHATYRDAPAQVSREYVEGVRATTDPVVFQREWECNFDSAEGMVYSMFDHALHVREPPQNARWTELLVGVDHGYEDPGVFLLVGVIGKGRDAVCWVIDEVYQTKQVPSWWMAQAKRFAEKWDMRVGFRGQVGTPTRWFADPSRPDMIQEYVRTGIRVEPAKNSIEDGVMAVADRLVPRLDPSDMSGKRRVSRLYISPKCKMLIEEMGKYKRRRDPKNPDRVLDDIVDAENHALDSARYAIFTRFGGPSRERHESGPGWGAPQAA